MKRFTRFALSLGVAGWFGQARAEIKYCIEQMRAEIARTTKDEILLSYLSQADLAQRVIGPLRRNKLSSAQADEIRQLSEDKANGFYELMTKGKGGLESRLLVVRRADCKIQKTYPLLAD